MNRENAWGLAFARQAQADFRAWELYQDHPGAVATNCHPLMFLQMACEKLCKAYLIGMGVRPEDVQASHGYTAKHLPNVIRRQILLSRAKVSRMHGVFQLARHLASEIELLSPSMQRGGLRQDNCEYPWAFDGEVVSPLDWSFPALGLLAVRTGPTFLKLLKQSIDQVVFDMEPKR